MSENLFLEASRMKQLPGDIRNRLSRPMTQGSISQTDLSETMEAQGTEEDGRQGAPSYFSSMGNGEKDADSESGSSDQDGKGTQIDVEV
jgi:hypothetical protein